MWLGERRWQEQRPEVGRALDSEKVRGDNWAKSEDTGIQVNMKIRLVRLREFTEGESLTPLRVEGFVL